MMIIIIITAVTIIVIILRTTITTTKTTRVKSLAKIWQHQGRNRKYNSGSSRPSN